MAPLIDQCQLGVELRFFLGGILFLLVGFVAFDGDASLLDGIKDLHGNGYVSDQRVMDDDILVFLFQDQLQRFCQVVLKLFASQPDDEIFGPVGRAFEPGDGEDLRHDDLVNHRRQVTEMHEYHRDMFRFQ